MDDNVGNRKDDAGEQVGNPRSFNHDAHACKIQDFQRVFREPEDEDVDDEGKKPGSKKNDRKGENFQNRFYKAVEDAEK